MLGCLIHFKEGWKPKPDKYGHQQRLGNKWRGSHTLIKHSPWVTCPIIIIGFIIIALPLFLLVKYGPDRWVDRDVDGRPANERNRRV